MNFFLKSFTLLFMIVLYKLLKKKKNNELITTLYYKLQNSQGQDVTERIKYNIRPDENLSEGTAITLTNKDFQFIEDTLISFFGYRIKPKPTGVKEVKPNYTELFNIIDVNNERFQATATYFDDGITFETTANSVTYVINGGNGKYSNAKTATIFFDNDGTKFGDGSNKFLRKIEIYS